MGWGVTQQKELSPQDNQGRKRMRGKEDEEKVNRIETKEITF